MKTQLYLIPYAGADVSCFTSLIHMIKGNYGEDVSIKPVELRGHGKRRKEPLYENIEDAVCDVMKQIDFHAGPVILYGHCTGGIITHAIYQKSKEYEKADIRSVILGSSIINKEKADNFTGFMNEYVEGNIKLMFPMLPDNMINQLVEYKKTIVAKEYSIILDYLLKSNIKMDEKQILVFGREDNLVDLETISKDYEELKDVKKVVVPGGHFFLEEASIELTQIFGGKIQEMETITV